VLAAAALALLLVAPGGSAAPAPPSAPEAALRAGDAAWAARGDPAQLAEALARYGEAARARPGDPAAELRLARAEAFHAQADPASAEQAWLRSSKAAERVLRRLSPAWAQAIDRGEEAGAAAARVEAAGAEALYLWAQGAMGLAQQRGFAAVLLARSAALGAMERAAALDGDLDSAGPWRALGAWRATLPSAAGGGAVASRQAFARARQLGRHCQLSRVREAETLAVLLQDRLLFERLLGEVLAFDLAQAPAWRPENDLARRQASALLARRDRLF